MLRKIILPVLVAGLFLAGCVVPQPAVQSSATPEQPTAALVPSLEASPTQAPTNTIAPAITTAPTVAPILAVTVTPTPASAPSGGGAGEPVATPAAPVGSVSAANYIDDRSTPAQVLVSYFNAINRQEYLRAYSYWGSPTDAVGSLEAFTSQFTNTVSVDLVFGQISAGAGAGQVYYSVPVLLTTKHTDGSAAAQTACYVVHQSQPANYGAPPFDPMGIIQANAAPAEPNANNPRALAEACSGYQGGGMTLPAEGSSLDISRKNFLDSRSGPVETVSSLLNALNSKEYVRAYGYFQNAATYPGPYDAYAAGFADTEVITATFGTVQSEGAAGSIYYNLPLAMQVATTSGAQQYFVGCYTLRLSQPAIQGVPPFRPMGITAGTFKKVNGSSDFSTLLTSACK